MKHAQRNTQAKGTRMEPILLKLLRQPGKEWLKPVHTTLGWIISIILLLGII